MSEHRDHLSLEWKRIEGRTDEWAYELAVLINQTPLLDLLHDWEDAHETDESKKITLSHGPLRCNFDHYLSGWLNEKFHRYDSAPPPKATLLGCACGELGCWPLEVTVTLTEQTAVWSDFFQPFRPQSTLYDGFGPFVFDREHYEKVVRQAIANSPVPQALPPLSVTAALENVEAAFAGLDQPARLEASPYVTETERLERLVTLPLGDLSPEEVGWYAAKAITTIGTEQDLLFFLPFILRHALNGSSWPGLEIIYRKARQCPLSEEQDDAMKELLLAYWVEFLQQDEGSPAEVREILIGAACFGLSWHAFLEVWEAADGLEPALKLAHFIEQNQQTVLNPEQFNAFLPEDAHHEMSTLWWWLGRSRTVNWLAMAEELTSDDADRAVLQAARDKVAALVTE